MRIIGSETTEACAENVPGKAQFEVMDSMFELLKDGKVSGVFWYSAYGWGWHNPALCTFDETERNVTLTDLGRHWLELKASL